MSKKSFFYYLIIFFFNVSLFSYCGKETKDIKLNKNEIILATGATETLIDVNSNKTVKWESSNVAVATVSDNGLVSAITNGKATITASTKNGKSTYYDYCSVIVDSRLNYIGDWNFVVKERNFSYGFWTEYTVSYYLGKIVLDDNEQYILNQRYIIIEYLENKTLRMIFTRPESEYIRGGNNWTYAGEFYEKNKVYIYHFRSNGSGSQKYEFSLEGTKIDMW